MKAFQDYHKMYYLFVHLLVIYTHFVSVCSGLDECRGQLFKIEDAEDGLNITVNHTYISETSNLTFKSSWSFQVERETGALTKESLCLVIPKGSNINSVGHNCSVDSLIQGDQMAFYIVHIGLQEYSSITLKLTISNASSDCSQTHFLSATTAPAVTCKTEPTDFAGTKSQPPQGFFQNEMYDDDQSSTHNVHHLLTIVLSVFFVLFICFGTFALVSWRIKVSRDRLSKAQHGKLPYYLKDDKSEKVTDLDVSSKLVVNGVCNESEKNGETLPFYSEVFDSLVRPSAPELQQLVPSPYSEVKDTLRKTSKSNPSEVRRATDVKINGTKEDAAGYVIVQCVQSDEA